MNTYKPLCMPLGMLGVTDFTVYIMYYEGKVIQI